MRKDPNGYVLVTPVEKVGIRVEDAPFLAVEVAVTRPQPEQVLRFSTNVGDVVEAGSIHPIRFEKDASGGIKPYIHVRGDLWPLVTRAASLELVELGEIRDRQGTRYFGVTSEGIFFAMANAEEAGEFKGSS